MAGLGYGLDEEIKNQIIIKREILGQVTTDLTKYPKILNEIESLNEKILSKQARTYEDLVRILLNDLNNNITYCPRNLKIKQYENDDRTDMLMYTNQVLTSKKGGFKDIELATWHLLDLILPDDKYELIYKTSKGKKSLVIYSSSTKSYIALRTRKCKKSKNIILKKTHAPQLKAEEVNDIDEDEELDDLLDDILQIGTLSMNEVRTSTNIRSSESVRDNQN